ncbi:hypothetical protein PIB30_073118 [Stylosanthes scabra]|uniref:Retrotransposon Copia-like N-terminal domain-containing protein n=1 Tax=Stylosanthes scabra TaxID=79078 RepID=A0ABU6XN66_9FABA|nr:hypothetical protein [Stylosanthes scabra]
MAISHPSSLLAAVTSGITKNSLTPIINKLDDKNFITWNRYALFTIKGQNLENHIQEGKTPLQLAYDADKLVRFRICYFLRKKILRNSNNYPLPMLKKISFKIVHPTIQEVLIVEMLAEEDEEEVVLIAVLGMHDNLKIDKAINYVNRGGLGGGGDEAALTRRRKQNGRPEQATSRTARRTEEQSRTASKISSQETLASTIRTWNGDR